MPHIKYKPAGDDLDQLPRQNFTIIKYAAQAQYSGPRQSCVTNIPTDFNSPIAVEGSLFNAAQQLYADIS
jgi:hypothetical protein